MTKNIFLVALFTSGVLLSLIACKKKESLLGKEIYDESMLLDANGVDTFSIVASTEYVDSTITANARLALLGSYVDPVFGKVSAGFYTQLRLAANNPDFGDIAAIVIDSVVLGMEYRDQYGLGNYQQDFAVFRVTEDLSADSLYQNNSTSEVGLANLIETGFESFIPDVKKPHFEGTDTVASPPQLRLRLKNSFGQELINSSTSGNMLNNETFLSYFKGLHVVTQNANITGNNGAVYSLDLLDTDSKLTIYYKQGADLKTFNLIINSNSVRYNKVIYDDANTKLSDLISNSALGSKEFYAQSGHARAVVRFPGVQNLNNKTVIHRATLYLPYQYFNGDDRYPSERIFVYNKRADGDGIWGLALNSGVLIPVTFPFVPQFSRYQVDVTSFIQGLVKQDPDFTNPELIIIGARTNDNVERIIFNGIESDNKYRPKLIITYTEF